MARTAVILGCLLARISRCDIDIACQIFDSTMVCDNEKDLVARGEIRTCSG